MWNRLLLCVAGGVVLVVSPMTARAGGGPMNVLVIYNADSTDASMLARYYRSERDIPVGHLCGISGVDPTQRTIDFADYQIDLHDPVAACLQALPHPEEIDYLVIVRGLPYRVNLPDGGFYTSLSAMLQVHEAARVSGASPLAGQPQYHGTNFQASIDNPAYVDGFCSGVDLVISNPYASWYSTACGIVRSADHPPSFRRADAGQADGYDFGGQLFIVTRLDGFDFQDASALVDRAVAADGSYPTAELLCMAGSDEPRAARDPECEFATRHLTLAGFTGTWLTPFDGTLTGHEVAAYFTGTANLRTAIAGQTYVPGAITGNLTSTGAAPANFFCNAAGDVCPQSESQTSIARFVRAGATGAHGTVVEPLNNTFPNAGTLLFYTFGYNLGESYFFNQQFIYWQNIYLGDPLTTPYADRPVVTFVPQDSAAQGSTLQVQATHPDGVAEVRLYLDGTLVADATGGLLDWGVSYSAGSTLDLLAVAVAVNVDASRLGWPVEVHHPQPDVQGWRAMALTVTEPVMTGDAGVGADSGMVGDDGGAGSDAGAPGDDSPDGGCNCRSSAGGGYPAGGLLMLLWWVGRRRRRV